MEITFRVEKFKTALAEMLWKYMNISDFMDLVLECESTTKNKSE